jgi:alkanesulfonate monooxygenase SsuD/methylene tetrahydromethanopterin reductase-like flavin-dependent oxidoreductase (luciferase family)
VELDVQLNPATSPWPRLRDAARAAEQAGFTTIWTWDHLTGSLLGGDTMLECFTLLGALAASTSRIGLGSLVVNVANRNPGVMAVAAASVQAIAGGRFTLGLGAGAGPGGRYSAEQAALGLHIPDRLSDRHARLEQALDRLDELWSPDRDARWAGFPRPDPRIPVVLGVNSLRLAELAGRRTQGINVRADHRELPALLSAAAAARAGRDSSDTSDRRDTSDSGDRRGEAGRPGPGSSGWTTSVWAPWDEGLLDADHPERRRLAALGVDRLVLVWLGPADPDRLAASNRHLG